MNIQEVKDYLRFEHEMEPEEVRTLESLITRAEIYIKNGVGEIDESNELFKMAVTVLVGHWYDNRELARIGNSSYPIPHSFEAIIQQLRYCYKKDDDE